MIGFNRSLSSGVNFTWYSLVNKDFRKGIWLRNGDLRFLPATRWDANCYVDESSFLLLFLSMPVWCRRRILRPWAAAVPGAAELLPKISGNLNFTLVRLQVCRAHSGFSSKPNYSHLVRHKNSRSRYDGVCGPFHFFHVWRNFPNQLAHFRFPNENSNSAHEVKRKC